jgi:hypothetical protein
MPYHDEHTSTHVVRTYMPSNVQEGEEVINIRFMRLPNGNFAPEEGWEEVKINVLAKHLGMSDDVEPLDVTVKYAEKRLKEYQLLLKESPNTRASRYNAMISNACKTAIGYIVTRKNGDSSIFAEKLNSYKKAARIRKERQTCAGTNHRSNRDARGQQRTTRLPDSVSHARALARSGRHDNGVLQN